MVLFTPLHSPVIFEELCSDVFAGTCGGVEAAGSSQKVSERVFILAYVLHLAKLA